MGSKKEILYPQPLAKRGKANKSKNVLYSLKKPRRFKSSKTLIVSGNNIEPFIN